MEGNAHLLHQVFQIEADNCVVKELSIMQTEVVRVIHGRRPNSRSEWIHEHPAITAMLVTHIESRIQLIESPERTVIADRPVGSASNNFKVEHWSKPY